MPSENPPPELPDQTVKAWLEGHPHDLQDLVNLFSEGDVRVVHDDEENGYYLTAPDIDAPSEPGRFDQPADALIKRLNGLARTHKADFRPVSLTGRYTSPTGTHVFVAAATMEVRARIGMVAVVVDGQLVPNPPSPWPNRLALAAANPDVAEALDIMGRGEPLGWDDLYKVHEIVRHAVRPSSITDYGWTDKPTDSAFRASANRPDVSGDDARHARQSGQRPVRTMSLAEGRSFIGDLVVQWLNHLAPQGDSRSIHPPPSSSPPPPDS